MAINQNKDEINAIIFEILEGIVTHIINGGYDDCKEEEDENLITSVENLLSAMDGNASSSGEAQSLELQEPEVGSTSVTEDAPLDNNAVQKDYEENVISAVASDTSTSGDAPSPKLELDDTTSTFVDGPLADEAKEDVLGDEHQQPVEGMQVLNSFGELVGWLDPAKTPGKCVPPRRNRLSTGWKRVKRIFRALCCCRSEDVRSSQS